MSNTYPDLISTQFPENIDDWHRFLDPTLSELSTIRQYETFINNGDLESARQLLDNNPRLQQMIINADNLNKFRDAVIALQRFYNDDVQNYLVEIVKYKAEFSSAVKYQKYNVVSYIVDSGYEIYMCVDNNTPIGTPPTNRTYWVSLTMRGEKGAPGTGLSPRGKWAADLFYSENDLVSHNNSLWAAKRDNHNIVPSGATDSDWWLILEYPSPWKQYTSLSDLGLTAADITASGTLATIVEKMPNYSVVVLDISPNSAVVNPSYPYPWGTLIITRNNEANRTQLEFKCIGTTDAQNILYIANYYGGTSTGYINRITPWRKVVTDVDLVQNFYRLSDWDIDLVAGDNLNDKKTPGVYRCLGTNLALSVANSPTNVNYKMVVESITYEKIVMQTVTSRTGVTYKRLFGDDSKWTVWESTDDLKKSVADGKSKVAKAISDKGQATAPDAPFDVMANNIAKIETDKTGDATATAAQILAGRTAYVKGVKVTGTIPMVEGKTVTPTTSQIVILPSGNYANGSMIVAGDSNLKAANIKKGVNIFGVAGTAITYEVGQQFLYNRGVWNTIAGGYVNTYLLSGFTVEPQSNYIKFVRVGSSTTRAYTLIRTQNTINLAGHNRLFMRVRREEYNFGSSTAQACYAYIGVSSSNNIASYADLDIYAERIISYSQDASLEQETSVNISNITGNKYVYFAFGCAYRAAMALLQLYLYNE